jgi:hypothetical protein
MLPWKRKTLTTCELSAHFRVPFRTLLAWFAANHAHFPRSRGRGGWNRQHVRALAREIKKNRAMLNTSQVAQLFHVQRDTPTLIWAKQKGFRLPPRTHLLGSGKGRTIRWSKADIRRLKLWLVEYRKTLKRRLPRA